uniref:MYND-type domain-containing protein n=1 Tax=Guillardia theta TaxID=55529 RepID=A0A6U5Y6N5_GUITH|mmetsp:Transcript_20506/g.68616  ORF Transcript_20506/g.68616 Transcript_20506/m.68616 type:complete len:1012 (+) Transcript_20506:1081-4116(+)
MFARTRVRRIGSRSWMTGEGVVLVFITWCSAASTAIPVLSKNENLLISTEVTPVVLSKKDSLVWKTTHDGGQAMYGKKALAFDPLRLDDFSCLVESLADSFNFLHKMQLCATEVAGVGTFLNGEVRFNGIPVEIPSLQDLRITLRITSRSESAHNGGKSLVLRPYFGDESVWCHLPPHGHVLPFFFTAGPNMIFTPCLETIDVLTWATSPQIKSFSKEDFIIVISRISAQIGLALAHVHDYGVVHRGVIPENIQIRACANMKLSLCERVHVLLADFGLTSQDLISTSDLPRGGTPGFWAPEEVPLDFLGKGSWCHDCVPGVKWSLLTFLNTLNNAGRLPVAFSDRREKFDSTKKTDVLTDDELDSRWTSMVNESTKYWVCEQTDSWQWAISCLTIFGYLVIASGEEERGVKEIIELESSMEAGRVSSSKLCFCDLIELPVGKAIKNCLLLNPKWRPLPTKFCQDLLDLPQLDRFSWIEKLEQRKVSREFPLAFQEVIVEDLPSLLNVMEDRTLYCNSLIGPCDQQTGRAQVCFMQTMFNLASRLDHTCSLRSSFHGDLVLREELFNLVTSTTYWIHESGPPRIVNWARKRKLNMFKAEKAGGEKCEKDEDAATGYCPDCGNLQSEALAVRARKASYEECWYIRALSFIAGTYEIFEHKHTAHEFFKLLVEFIGDHLIDRHISMLLPKLHCMRLEAELESSKQSGALNIIRNGIAVREIFTRVQSRDGFHSQEQWVLPYGMRFSVAADMIVDPRRLKEDEESMGRTIADRLCVRYMFPPPDMVMLSICDGLLKSGIELEQIFEMSFKFARMALEFAKDVYGEFNLRSYIPYLAICELPQMPKIASLEFLRGTVRDMCKAITRLEDMSELRLSTPMHLPSIRIYWPQPHEVWEMTMLLARAHSRVGDVETAQMIYDNLGREILKQRKSSSSSGAVQQVEMEAEDLVKVTSQERDYQDEEDIFFPTVMASLTCSAPGCVRLGSFQCKNCKVVRYCSAACQREDWKRHRPNCKKQ